MAKVEAGAEVRPVKMSELMNMNRWELSQLIKVLAADRDEREIRWLVDTVRDRYKQKQVRTGRPESEAAAARLNHR